MGTEVKTEPDSVFDDCSVLKALGR